MDTGDAGGIKIGHLDTDIFPIYIASNIQVKYTVGIVITYDSWVKAGGEVAV